MSADGKSNSGGNVVLKGVSSEVEDLRIRDDAEGLNRGYQLGNSNEFVQKPDPRPNNADVLLHGQLRSVKILKPCKMKYIIWEQFH